MIAILCSRDYVQNSGSAELSTCLKFEIYSTRTKRLHISVMWASITNITSLNNITERIIRGVNVMKPGSPSKTTDYLNL